MAFLSAQPANQRRSQRGKEPLIVNAALSEPRQDEADASGRAEIVFDSPGTNLTREVERIILHSTSSVEPEALVFVGAEDDVNFMDGSPEARRAAADYPRGLRVPGDQVLRVVFNGADSGSICTARIQYVDMQWVDVDVGQSGGQ